MLKPSTKGATKTITLPPRSKVKVADTWDLTALFKTDADWEREFKKWQKTLPRYTTFKGKLAEGAKTIRALLEFDRTSDRVADKLGTYAFLKTSEDQANSDYQRMKGRYISAATEAGELAAFIRPELLAIPTKKMDAILKSPELAEWKLTLERIIRYRPHTLSDGEEKLLAMQGQMSEASGTIFRQLIDSDLKWPALLNEKGESVELSNSTFILFLESPDRNVRETAFKAYYKEFEAHKNTIAASLNGSVQRDVYYAKARGFASARESALFSDNVPVAVYDNLIGSVRKNLPTLHRYYELRRRAMKLKEVHQYDTYAPIFSDVKAEYAWEKGAKTIADALAPLGSAYTSKLYDGLTKERWCDRYPNRSKSSGAFSSGSYDGLPYILMNYQPTLLDHVFTLAHEAGHSMHSFYSCKNQPYQYSNYTIFVAEVASTFNEQLLGKHLMDNAKDKRERAYLLNKMIDDIRGTIIRQTMFAEFEKVSHALVEAGEPLTVDTLRKEYRKLLDAYFGPRFAIDNELELECMRIPHFYRAFYVYKYATGLSAAIALSQKVLNGGPKDVEQYLGFLKAGCSKWPIDILKDAGVDMSKPAPVDAAMKYFGKLVDELEEVL
jgi:oligoendopeptidase F